MVQIVFAVPPACFRCDGVPALWQCLYEGEVYFFTSTYFAKAWAIGKGFSFAFFDNGKNYE